MSATVRDTATTVPIAGDRDVTITPGQPWPSAYRGSRYSVVDSRKHGTVLQWAYKGLKVMVPLPDGLVETLRDLGKGPGTGKGSIRITSDGEILTKIHSSGYVNADEASTTEGWIPVYVGELAGELEFDIDIDPGDSAETPTVWNGFPFNHGERWAVGANDRLIWKWQDYRFESAFEHPDIVDAYREYRSRPGRLYINEYGHVWINVPRDEVPDAADTDIDRIFTEWKRDREQQNDTAALQLVNRRLKVTGDGNPEEGHLPLYIGHLNDFDGSAVPKPVVDDETYYVAAARGEELDHY